MKKINEIKVNIWGKNVGVVRLLGGVPTFQYNKDFEQFNLELSPIKVPFDKNKTHIFYNLNYADSPFYGLPGFIADSLPDKFGGDLIKEWLKLQGKTEKDITILERLAYVGKRGIGAIEFEPVIENQDFNHQQNIEIPELFDIVEKILAKKNSLEEKIPSNDDINSTNIKQIISIGTSAGGARAKAIVAIKKSEDGDLLIKSGGFDYQGYEDFLIKFDSALNSDKEEKDGSGYTNVEYAYYLIAKDCEINMSDSSLLTQKVDHQGNNLKAYHFITKRFDRFLDNNGIVHKKHMVSLAGLLHNDFNKSRTLDYLDVFDVIEKIIPFEQVEKTKIEFFKRAVFNVLARNQDDHSKNISFLMDERGQWSLSPFYDVTFAYNPNGIWTSRHQMTVLSVSDNQEITYEVLMNLGKRANLNKKDCHQIITNTLKVLDNFETYMRKALVKPERVELMKKNIHTTKNFVVPKLLNNPVLYSSCTKP